LDRELLVDGILRNEFSRTVIRCITCLAGHDVFTIQMFQKLLGRHRNIIGDSATVEVRFLWFYLFTVQVTEIGLWAGGPVFYLSGLS